MSRNRAVPKPAQPSPAATPISAREQLLHALNLQAQGKVPEAHTAFQRLLEQDPNNGPAYYSLSLIASQTGNLQQALELAEQGVLRVPGFAPLHFIKGALLHSAGYKEPALASFDAALSLQPDYPEALLNSGVVLRDLLRHQEALERFNRILLTNPDHVTALANCAILLTEFKQSREAIQRFERLLALQPDYDYGPGLLCYERLHICDWNGHAALAQHIIEGVRANRRACKTLALMAISDQASDHFQAAKVFAQHHYPRKSGPLWQGQRYRHDRIKLAYVSPDLREHPVGHLMAGIFERHDRNRFETYAISLGVDDGSANRQRIQRCFDHFIDAKLHGSQQIAQFMRDQEIEIAVDLAGYTADSRMDIFAHKAVPVQVNYLGYPGTSGTDYMDYILADAQVIPPEHCQYYTERVVYLPDCYLPVAADVTPNPETPKRAEHGLPEQGLVFCCFNHDYKISPETFATWLQLLREVPGSVLWLMSRNELSQRNLQQATAAAGLDPARLIFAGRVPRVEDHLARYRLADLFLDTHPYNAHTTAADALLSGLPVVTYLGNAFPARVAASLLRSAGLAQLIGRSREEYLEIALRLARNPGELEVCKAQLQQQRQRAPLFDATRFCRDLEAAYIAMWRHYQLRGLQDDLG